MAAGSDQPPLIVVVGETASGKSALAMELARRYKGEIICADSRTIFKGMDIGTAKPTSDERAEIPHFLLDVVQPDEDFSVADFQALAQEAITDIVAREKLPIMVGGTGLYTDAVLFNYTFTTKADTHVREQYAALTVPELQKLVTAHGFELPTNEKNPRHLIRILEKGNSIEDRSTLRNNTLVLGVVCSRAVLRKRIENRVERMFRQGLRREVEDLLQKYGWESEALTGIGYREFKAHYEETKSMGEVKRQIAQDTLHLAKRQRTWFKRNPFIQWVEAEQEAFAKVDAFLQTDEYNQ